LRAATSGGTYSAISGATSSSYILASADVGKFLKVAVTASNVGGSTTDTSIATTAVNALTSSTSVTLDVGNLLFRTVKTISATPTVAGKLTFRANNVIIAGCKNLSASANVARTCNYKPNSRGYITISVTLNPTDSAGMTTQLAQLNMVDGINKMNTSMTSLLSQIQSTDFISMATTVGKTAMAEGNKVLFTGESVNLGAKLASDASSVTATIKNSAGATVAETDLGPGSEGLFNFIWDGLDGEGNVLPAGFYSVSILAKTADGNTEYPKVYSSSKVATIGKDGSDLEVTLADGRTIKPSDIEQWVA
jgi:flagellar basal-body rod modification protein FlgD